jgi:hypothetical protein
MSSLKFKPGAISLVHPSVCVGTLTDGVVLGPGSEALPVSAWISAAAARQVVMGKLRLD